MLYAVCALTREFLEPKLIGNKIGVWPVGILFAVFGGIKLFGIAGIVKGPLSLVIICEICRYLWKREEKLIVIHRGFRAITGPSKVGYHELLGISGNIKFVYPPTSSGKYI